MFPHVICKTNFKVNVLVSKTLSPYWLIMIQPGFSLKGQDKKNLGHTTVVKEMLIFND